MDREYSDVTEQVLKLIEEGTESWRPTWGQKHLLPRNLITDKPYRGGNAHRLASRDFESKYWVTEKQAEKKGGSIREDEEGVRCQFWSTTSRKDSATGQRLWSAFSRHFTVYNVEQCQNLDVPVEILVSDTQRILKECERIYSNVPNAPTIEYKGLRPFYYASRDTILMPNNSYFEWMEDFYSTLYHELVHATGSINRLKRPGVYQNSPVGSTDYVREEIVAELGALYLCTRGGIESHVINNSASYIRMWLARTSDKVKFLSSAIPLAENAADFVLDNAR